MKLLKFAAGLAVGYVLGTRAGRERFEQLAGDARKLSEHPKVSQLQDKAKQVLSGGSGQSSGTTTGTGTTAVPAEPLTVETVTVESGPSASTVAESASQPRPRRRSTTTMEDPATDSPL